mmetsp:Transcript_34068/g.88402  ORF Transcript_34068/g.88402 Transcript_34068/m.88402 type:complete len:398 (-) Transcript_34068:7-1200(-)
MLTVLPLHLLRVAAPVLQVGLQAGNPLLRRLQVLLQSRHVLFCIAELLVQPADLLVALKIVSPQLLHFGLERGGLVIPLLQLPLQAADGLPHVLVHADCLVAQLVGQALVLRLGLLKLRLLRRQLVPHALLLVGQLALEALLGNVELLEVVLLLLCQPAAELHGQQLHVVHRLPAIQDLGLQRALLAVGLRQLRRGLVRRLLHRLHLLPQSLLRLVVHATHRHLAPQFPVCVFEIAHFLVHLQQAAMQPLVVAPQLVIRARRCGCCGRLITAGRVPIRAPLALGHLLTSLDAACVGEELHHIAVLLGCGEVQRGGAVVVLEVGGSLVLQEGLHDACVALVSGAVQRRPLIAVLAIDLDIPPEEVAHRLVLSIDGRVVQRGAAVLVARRFLGARGNEG